jgi:hypothetical protein
MNKNSKKEASTSKGTREKEKEPREMSMNKWTRTT